jgi:hypothetical protein
MSKSHSQPGQIHLQIIEVMKRYPQGISAGQIRQELEKEGLPRRELRCLPRHIGELDRWFIIEEDSTTEALPGSPGDLVHDDSTANRQRAEILYLARGRCQRCGRTIAEHGISLLVRRRPGRIAPSDNRGAFWAICQACEAGPPDHPGYGCRHLRLRPPISCGRSYPRPRTWPPARPAQPGAR